MSQNILITGASQGIGLGFVEYFLSHIPTSTIFATHRLGAEKLLALKETYPDQLHCLSMDITQETDIIEVVKYITTKTDRLHWVINCVGILHEENLQPEKNLRSLEAHNLLRYFAVNSIGAVLLAKHLVGLLKHQNRSVFATISAKVGSITDNQMGGWYGYRASKAALNMFIRSAALEYRRICPQTIVVLLHPGTTDTKLSLPFQANVAPDKLFSTDRAVSQLVSVLEGLNIEQSGNFFAWDGTNLPW